MDHISGNKKIVDEISRTGQEKGKDSYYILLNKNVEVARFHVDPMFDTIYIDEVLVELPFWITNLRTFIINRRAPKHRENIEKLLKESGCDTIKGFLDITHALSLIDCFWVKPRESRLQWENVSLYTHPFDEAIARTAFEGGLHGRHFSSTSPEYGTDGSFAKCWIRENGRIKLLKRGSSGARNAGLEPYSEYYTCQLIKQFTDHFVSYDLRSRHGRICSVCEAFTNEKIGFLPYAAVDTGNTDYVDVIKTCEELTEGGGDFARMMFVVDAVILNEDRHKNNFGFLVDNEKQEILGMAPLLDHNIAMLPYAEAEDFEQAEEYLSHKGPRLSDDWIRTAASCLSKDTQNTLIRLKGFTFERHEKYNLPEERLHAIEEIIQKHVEGILKYVS